jgi:hypothetical protein
MLTITGDAMYDPLTVTVGQSSCEDAHDISGDGTIATCLLPEGVGAQPVTACEPYAPAVAATPEPARLTSTCAVQGLYVSNTFESLYYAPPIVERLDSESCVSDIDNASLVRCSRQANNITIVRDAAAPDLPTFR